MRMGVLRSPPVRCAVPWAHRRLFFRPCFRPPPWMVALVVPWVPAATGIDDEAGPGSSTSSPATDPSAEESGTDAELVDAPAIGTCWRMPPAKAADKDYWFDDSPQVPCTERHTLETVAVYPLASADPGARPGAGRRLRPGRPACTSARAQELGALAYDAFLPSQDQIADGASWARCDVAFAAQTSGIRPRLVHGVGGGGGPAAPRGGVGMPGPALPEADHPRLYVALRQAARLRSHRAPADPRGSRRLPHPAGTAHRGKDCQVALRNPDYEGLAVRALWRPPADTGTTLLGSCWVHRPDGQDLPPLQ